MLQPLRPLMLATICLLAGCQQTQPPAASPVQEAEVAPAAGALTEAAARTAVAGYLQQQPNASLYQLDSARLVDMDTHWQVMVPRTDWAGRMPNAAAFEVNKQTGRVSTLRVK